MSTKKIKIQSYEDDNKNEMTYAQIIKPYNGYDYESNIKMGSILMQRKLKDPRGNDLKLGKVHILDITTVNYILNYEAFVLFTEKFKSKGNVNLTDDEIIDIENKMYNEANMWFYIGVAEKPVYVSDNLTQEYMNTTKHVNYKRYGTVFVLNYWSTDKFPQDTNYFIVLKMIPVNANAIRNYASKNKDFIKQLPFGQDVNVPFFDTVANYSNIPPNTRLIGENDPFNRNKYFTVGTLNEGLFSNFKTLLEHSDPTKNLRFYEESIDLSQVFIRPMLSMKIEF